MKQVHIIDALVESIEQKIYEEWKHEGGILGCSSEHINFDIDGREYVLLIREIEQGESFCQFHIAKDGADNGRT